MVFTWARKVLKFIYLMLKSLVLSVADLLLLPFVYPSAWLLEKVRRAGVHRLPRCKRALLNVGVFPVRNHYYETQFDFRDSQIELSEDRALPGIAWNEVGQLKHLEKLTFAAELSGISKTKVDPPEFHFNNAGFESGDAEYWYQMIRAVKPRRIIEIGSGNSTLMAIKATRKNKEEDASYLCQHTCIEPYEMPWLEKTGVTVMRKKVEDVDLSFFSELTAGDILFIDSSHIIKPHGDVLFEYLQLLPTLNQGVIVHVHDIFSPKNYLKQWVEDEVKFWNEQYLLEAFLSHNGSWEIIGALNYLHHHHPGALAQVCPYLTSEREPASFYLRKVA